MNYREFVDWAKDCVESIGESFDKTDDDWLPVALIEGGDGGVKICALAFEKSLWPEAIAGMVKEWKAQKVALITSSWTLEFESAEEGEAYMNDPDALPPSESPNRTEALVVSIFDAERVESWSARIIRSDEPPELSEWTNSGEVDGRMIGPIREALR